MEELDASLLKQVKKDSKTFVKLYRKYFKTIYKYVLFKVGLKKEIAEDIVSEVFLKALSNIEKVNLSKNHTTLLPWFYVIARNETIKWYKTSSKGEISLDSDILESVVELSNHDSENIVDTIEVQRILECLSNQSQSTKDIVYMKIYEQYSFKEIADILKMKESAVKMQYYRGLENVTKILNNRL